ncbi:sarcosine oxidase subunit alpha [Tamaricihabitans halophyticus]|uniref:Sarcosine oxidase subunit alpha n=1 Tax=Tamaricihabitans halophyticus TaxID=1262583 RepID=A0A4R2QQ63_9PSEU|nr:2Fe-2S iron-sulfur cluster-binding protein [Tamaricihabitans halophyticus]TCP51872.1 sarcosine oxidase subunit alpha [Tamaricihabitans halophyticus]
MINTNRLSGASGDRIDRTRILRFTFDGTEYTGHPGDTLASALLANGVLGYGPSIYADRPRGVVSAGTEEPNALVRLRAPQQATMLPATTVELVDGLVADSLSGIGRLDASERVPGADTLCDKKYVHADVVVIGAGPAGLAAAAVAARSGARVLVAEERRELGGALLDARAEQIDGAAAADWIKQQGRQLLEAPETRVLTSSTVVGYYDHNYLLIAQRNPDASGIAQRLWHVRAKQVIIATGAHERPIVFADNDRPGIMLAGAVRRYLNRFAVLPGRRAVVFTSSDSAYDTALDLLAAGGEVSALVDARPEPPQVLVDSVRDAGAEVITGSAVVGTHGAQRITGVRVAPIDADGAITGAVRELDCDLLAVGGGWSPVVHLYGQAGGQLRWDDCAAAFVPAEPVTASRQVIGAARGTFDLAGCVAQGQCAGAKAATEAGYRVAAPAAPEVRGAPRPSRPRQLWLVPGETADPADWTTHFVDLQRDATVRDVWRAVGTGMVSVEHVKRYTTISTGADQGKTSGVNAIGVLAEALGQASIGDVGTTTFRPPYTPVTFSLLAGRDRAELSDPVRTTPIHSWHVEHGALFENVGQWKRPWYYPLHGEDMEQAVLRECRAARTGVAMQDASTLGKIEIVGPDAPEFLNRIYTNGFAKLAVGSARYGLQCKADGMVFDDGVSLRLAEDRYLMTTTTGNAAAVLDWLEEWLQTEWPDLAVHCTSVTEQWSTVAVVGPDSRDVIARLAPDLDVSAAAFPFMAHRETTLASGIPARICRISFSGELAFEVNVASWFGLALWEQVYAAGADYGITPYGTETMHVLRAEKGFPIVGQDTDGTVTPDDLGMGWAIAKHKDFIGKRSFARPDTARTNRKQLVGLLPLDPDEVLPEGAALVEPPVQLNPPVPMLGHVTSSYRSAVLDRGFALALIESGRARIGEVVHAPLGERTVPARVTKPVFYDEEGNRRDGR